MITSAPPSDPETASVPYRIVNEGRHHFIVVDSNDVEIAGARKPQGHNYFLVYSTPRLTCHAHQVIAPTEQIARWHLEMLAQLFTAGVS